MTIRRLSFATIAVTSALFACALAEAAAYVPPLGSLTAESLASLASAERATALGGVRFGSSPTAVAMVMRDLGLRSQGDPDNDPSFPHDQYFEGRLKGHPVIVIALYDGAGSLQKMIVSFVTPDKDCLPFYRRVKDELTEEYGHTQSDFEFWSHPYNNGGHIGHEETAIRSGKAKIAASWDVADRGREDGGIVLSVEDRLTVWLVYESSEWGEESERRKRMQTAKPSHSKLRTKLP